MQSIKLKENLYLRELYFCEATNSRKLSSHDISEFTVFDKFLFS